MSQQIVSLLGPARVTWEAAEPPRFRSQRTVALLGHLTTERRPVAREALVTLFWPDESPTKGKANLRRELHNLANMLPGCWQTDYQVVHFSPGVETSVDVYQLLQLEEAEQWLEAAELLRGDFLEGVYLDGNLEFETWLLGERERWRQRADHILGRAVAVQVAAGDNAAALAFARRLLKLRPWHEEMHRTVMLLLAQQGQTSAALKQYETCKQVLWDELGVEVSPDTQALYERVRDPSPFALHNIPAPTTPLIGREEELALLNRWLQDDDVRLITITGVGGMGKTRLMLALAEALLDRPDHSFSDGIYFASLAALDDPAHLVSEIAAILRFPLHGQDRRSPRQRLLDYLQQKQMLLLFDNFEQLLPGAELASDILKIAPGVQIMATSRERLRLQGEQLMPLQGLPHNRAGLPRPHAMPNDAVRLFLSAAGRVRPGFTPSDNEDESHLYRICQLVEGMPLALELAAAWIDTLSLEVIADEIERGLDLLEREVRDLPDRHRSIRAVFDTSWHRLRPKERRVFASLSVFRGPFSRAAALAVTGATVRYLARLVNYSLLQKSGEDRYTIHQLLRQYAAEKLWEGNEEARATEERFVTYYGNFLEQRGESLHGREQQQVMVEISTELDNVRAAWEWALARRRRINLHRMVRAYVDFLFYQTRYQEAATVAARAATVFNELHPLEERDLARAEALNRLAWCQIRVGYIAEAQAAAQESFDIYSRLNRLPPPGFATDSAIPLAIVALVQGARVRAVELAEQARALAESREDGLNLGLAHHVLSSAHAAAGQYDAAYDEAQRACTLARREGHEWFLGYALLEVGKAAQATGRYVVAKHYYEASIPIRRRLNAKGEAEALGLLGEVALLQLDYESARRLVQDALAIYQETKDRGGVARAHQSLGQIACAELEYELARRHLEQALTIATDTQFRPLIVSLFVDIGKLLVETGELSLGTETLALAQNHSAAEHVTKTRATEELAGWEPRVDAQLFSKWVRRGKKRGLETAILSVQRALSAPLGVPERDSRTKRLF